MPEEHSDINRELLEINKKLIASGQKHAAILAEVLCMLARDTVTITDLALPSDEAAEVLIRGARRRAEKILAGFGGGHQSHH